MAKQTKENHPDGVYTLSEDFERHGNSGWWWVERFDGSELDLPFEREVRTNGHGEGLFFRRKDGTWQQAIGGGTCQYSLPFNRRSAIARRRRELAEFEAEFDGHYYARP